MKDKLLVISDGGFGIPYKSVITFFDCDIRDKILRENEIESGAVIIELSDKAEAVKAAAIVREIRPEVGILFIVGHTSPLDNTLLKGIGGYGMVRIMAWNSEYPEKITEELNVIINPEYPSGKTDIAIILPVYNEESRFGNVSDFVVKLKTFLEKGFLNSRIFFVNDGSIDNTDKLIEAVVEKGKKDSEFIFDKSYLSAKELKKNTKKAGTYIEGIKTIEADILLFVDADDSFAIEDMALMINILRKGYYDMVVGTKDMTAEKRPPIRKLMSFVKRMMTKAMLPKGVYDSQTGLKAMKGSAAKFILPYLNNKRGLAIDLEILYYAKKLDMRVLQLPVKCIDRDGSHVDIVKDSISFIKNIFSIVLDSKNKI